MRHFRSATFAVICTVVMMPSGLAAEEITGLYTRTDTIAADAKSNAGETVESYVALYRKRGRIHGHIRLVSPASGTFCSMSQGEASDVDDTSIDLTQTAFGKTCELTYTRKGDSLVFAGSGNCSIYCGTANNFAFKTEPLTRRCDTVDAGAIKGIGKYNTVKDADLLCGSD